jgi:CO/xanthine dehydrogenase FAD-binding subunit
MWPAAFEYHAARSSDEAVDLLARLPGVSVLAGGLSLLPAMRRRGSRPAHLVDINPAPELATVETHDGGVTVGATCRQADLHRWARRTAGFPLLTDALDHTGTHQTRQRGTVAGILATGNPATQLAAVSSVLGARVRLRDTTGTRTVPAHTLFAGDLAPGTLVAAVEFPSMAAGDGHAFLQCARRAVGAAIGGVAVRVRLAEDGTCLAADVTPFLPGHDGSRLPTGHLVGGVLGDRAVTEAAEHAAEVVTPVGDVMATADYRRHLVRVLVRRGLTLAAQRAGGDER